MKRRWPWLAWAICGVAVGFWAWSSLAPAQDAAGPTKQADQAQPKAKKLGQRAKNQAASGQAKADDHPVANDPNARPAEAAGPWLSSGDSYDDFCSVAQSSDGTLYAAYAAYYDGHDQIRLHKQLEKGRWSTRVYVPLVEAQSDIWMPQLAVDAQDRLWVIWSEHTGRTERTTGNWDLYARALVGQDWGPIVRLTTDPRPDINHHVVVDAKHGIHVVWQAHPENNGDIQLCRLVGDAWSKPVAVTTGSASDWYPQLAIDAQGTEWIAFDSYRNGDYDVFLTSVRGNEVGPIVPVATSRYYEAHPTVACAADGRVWLAWEQGGWLWGKDQGHWLKVENRDVGTRLGSSREVKVAVYHNGQLSSAPLLNKLPETPLPEGLEKKPPIIGGGTAGAGLAADAEGRVWLRYRGVRIGPPKAAAANARRGNKHYWTENVAWLSADGWQGAQELPLSNGRISVFSRQIVGSDGTLHVAYSGDMRTAADYHQPIQDRCFVASLPKPEGRAGVPELSPYQVPEPPQGARDYDVAREAEQVKMVQSHRLDIGGVPHQIVRGDLHRHTELSWDVGPLGDGSFLDFYRYMIDVAAMDFGALTDHQGGGHYAYHWWLTQKSADMYYLPPRFVPLYGYERSVKFPNGHRNVFHAYRGVPVFPFQTKLGSQGVFPGVSSDVLDNDTKLLYEFLHRTGGLAISHTSATDTMGTDWRDNDPQIEPVVEIYQGARNSSEALGGPRVHPIDREPRSAAPGGFQEAGLMWNAWGKGYRLGVTSSSDHGSTHLSYSLVYTPKIDRAEILQAMHQRQTYGATDNMIVSCEADGHFMGQEYSTTKNPTLKLTVRGTGKVDRVDLIRNAAYIYTGNPRKADVDVTFTDMQPKPGLNYYYFRVLQEDGEVAWASPIWVNIASGGQ